MKKIISIILTLILALGAMTLVACKKDGDVSVKNTEFDFELKKAVDEDGDRDDYYVIRSLKISDDDSDKIDEGETIEIVIPATYKSLPVREIKENALKNVKGISKISFEKNAEGKYNIQTINSGAFAGCSDLTEIELPFTGKSLDAKNEEKLFGYVFGTESSDGCTSITQSRNAGTDTTAYYVPSALTKVTLDGENLAVYAFSGNTIIETLVFSGNVETIPEGFFKGCTALNEITIPDSVTTIGNDAFNGCTGLYGIDLNNVTSLGNGAFSGCTKLGFGDNTLVVNCAVIGEDVFNGCTTLSKLEISTSVIPSGAFNGCTALKNVKLTCASGGVIKSGAFMNCGEKLIEANVIGLTNYDVEDLAFDFQI